MAEVKGVTISASSIKKLKEEIKTLKANINELALAGQGWDKEAQALAQKQLELSRATEMTKGAVVGLKGSYAGLVAETNELRKKWRLAPIDSDEFKELSDKIAENNEKLKSYDASIGDYFRNVGNYSGGFADALNKMGLNLGGLMPKIKDTIEGGTKMIEVISNAPAVIASASMAIKGLTASLHGVKAALVSTGIGIALVALGSLVAYWDEVTSAVKRFLNISDRASNAFDTLNNKVESFSYKLQRMREGTDFERRIDEALGKDSVEVLEKAIERAEERLLKAKKDAEAKFYDLAILAAVDEENKEKSVEKLAQLQEEIKKEEDELRKLKQDLEIAKIKAEVDARKAQEQAKADAEKLKQDELTKITEINNEITLSNLSEKEREIAITKAKYIEKIELFKKYNLDTTDLEQQRENEIASIRKKYRDKEADEAAAANATIVQQEVDDAKKVYDAKRRFAELEATSESDKAAKLFSIQQEALSEELSILEIALQEKELSAEKEIELKRRIADVTLEIEYNKAAEEKRLSEEVRAKKEADVKSAWEVSTAAASATSSILGSIADMYEKEGEANKEATKKAKNLRIAGATMDMLGGIVSAWASALNPANSGMTIWGQIAMAGITSATMLATGIANIAKIRNTDTNGTTSGGVGAAVSAPSIVQQVPVTRTLTGAAEEERMNQAQRVYVVYDDIAQAGRKTEVTEQESTF